MKKIFLALALSALFASSAFAFSVNMEVVGIIGGDAMLVDENANVISGPLRATALSVGITDSISAALGITMMAKDKYSATLFNPSTGVWYPADLKDSSASGIYVNAFYKLLRTGDVSHLIGVEGATMSAIVGDFTATDNTTLFASKVNITYRASAKVLGSVSMLFDIELLSMGSSSAKMADGDVHVRHQSVALETAKLGFSIPVL